MSEKVHTHPGSRRWFRWGIIVGLLFGFALLGLLTASWAFNTARQFVSSWEITSLENMVIEPTVAAAPEKPEMTSNPAALPTGEVLPTPDPWNGASRVTILVMGLDYRDWEQGGGPPRTDTMILLTIDPLSKTAGILSLQRDLWVTIPGMEGYQKINTAYRFGELYKLPGGGPALAIKTVENLVGVQIDYYAQIDFQAFENFIDEIGGITIDIPEEIKVDPIGPGNTVVLKPGRQHINGSTALGYARNRYTKLDDFDRAQRQQQVILAIRARVLRVDILPRLVLKAPALYQTLGSGIHTNLNLQQAIQLAWLAQSIPQENIHRAMIGPNDAISTKAPDGQDILIPIASRIRKLRDDVFVASIQPGAEGMSVSDQIRGESARVQIVNSSGDPEVAQRAAETLRGQGIQVVEETSGGEVLSATRLVDHSGKPYTIRYLVDIMKIQPNSLRSEFKAGSTVDITLYLGKDWAKANRAP